MTDFWPNDHDGARPGVAAAPLDVTPLYRPLSVRDLTLRNRVVMSPMTRESGADGILGVGSVDHYAARARGGVGLIVTEATTIGHNVAHYSTREPYMFGQPALDAWRPVVAAVHAAGAAIFPQLWHTGVSRKRRQVHNPDVPSLSASAVSSAELGGKAEALATFRGATPAREANDSDIASVVEAFGESAHQAKGLGFDGIALHGGHGYLLYQFLWHNSNRRTDGYGGAPAERARLSVEVVREVRRRVGPSFPIMFRFSQWSGWDYEAKIASTPAELGAILEPLADAGVDIFDASTRRFWMPEFASSDLNLAGWAKKLTGKFAMTVGSVGLASPLGGSGGEEADVALGSLSMLLKMLTRGDFDIVGVGRGLLANADWANLVQMGRLSELNSYVAAIHGALSTASKTSREASA